MTTLTITPNWKNKTAKFKGTIAAGEHVAVSIVNVNDEGDEYIQAEDLANLRLRVVNPANGKTLAQFPMPVAEGETPDAWDDESITPLSCVLNLNTDRMLMAVPPAANVPLLFVLDAYKGATDEDEGEFTLYFKDMCEVTHWPRRRGEEEPTRLDDYKDLIKDFNARLTDAETDVANAVSNANTAADRVSEALDTAETFVTRAENAESNAQAHSAEAGNAATAAQAAQVAAETAQGKAEDAQEAAESAQSAAGAAQVAAETAQGAAETAQAGAEAAAAEAVSEVADDLAAEVTRATAAEAALGTRIDAEALARDDAIASAISAVKDSAPAAFDTLKEIADWIGDGTSGAQAVINQVANKVDKVSGKGLSTNDYTIAEKTKLSGIAEGANNYTLPAASANTLGGVKQGSGCIIEPDGTLNVPGGGGSGDVTRAEIEAGWWSEWTVISSTTGDEVDNHKPVYIVANGWWEDSTSGQILSTSIGESEADYFEWRDTVTDEACTATRRRVAAPVPMKSEDIGAQPSIADLADIRAGAALGATAVQPSALAGAVRYDLISSLADTGARTGWTFSGDAEEIADYAITETSSNGIWTLTLYEDSIEIATDEITSTTAPLYAEFNIATRTITASRQIAYALPDRACGSLTVAAPVSPATEASAAFMLPAAVSGKIRDCELSLTFGSESTDTGTLTASFIDPATGAAPVVDFGADSLGDIAIGRNLVMFSEVAPNRWLVMVKHEDFPAI